MTESSSVDVKECRICESDRGLKLIFKEANRRFIEMLTTVASVSISTDDGLPKYICCDCVPRLTQAYKFKLQCETNDYLLRSRLGIGTNKNRVVVTKTFINNGKPEVLEAPEEPAVKKPKLEDLKSFRIETEPQSSSQPSDKIRLSFLQEDTDGAQYECLRCGLKFSDVEALQKHFRMHILHYCKHCTRSKNEVATEILENLYAARAKNSMPPQPTSVSQQQSASFPVAKPQWLSNSGKHLTSNGNLAPKRRKNPIPPQKTSVSQQQSASFTAAKPQGLSSSKEVFTPTENLPPERAKNSIPPQLTSVSEQESASVTATKPTRSVHNRIITLPIKDLHNKSNFMEVAELADIPVQVSEMGKTNIKTGVLKLLKCKICNFFFDQVNQFKAHCRAFHAVAQDEKAFTKVTKLQKQVGDETSRAKREAPSASESVQRLAETQRSTKKQPSNRRDNIISKAVKNNQNEAYLTATPEPETIPENDKSHPQALDDVDLTDPLDIGGWTVETIDDDISFDANDKTENREKQQTGADCFGAYDFVESDISSSTTMSVEKGENDLPAEFINFDLNPLKTFITSQNDGNTKPSAHDRSSDFQYDLLSLEINSIEFEGFPDLEH